MLTICRQSVLKITMYQEICDYNVTIQTAPVCLEIVISLPIPPFLFRWY